jgi:hypothetical protein
MTNLTLERALVGFLKALAGKNWSRATIKAYAADIHQFIRNERGGIATAS